MEIASAPILAINYLDHHHPDIDYLSEAYQNIQILLFRQEIHRFDTGIPHDTGVYNHVSLVVNNGIQFLGR